MLRKLAAVSIIALICVSLTSAYIGNSSNATNATTNNTNNVLCTDAENIDNTNNNIINNKTSFNETSNKTMSNNVTNLSTTEDLEVVMFEVTKPFVNELSLVRAWIKNNGASVVRNLSVSFNVNGHTEDSKVILLEPDTVALVTFCWVPNKTGNYTLNVTVDVNNEITEENETNNCKEECVHVLSLIHI